MELDLSADKYPTSTIDAKDTISLDVPGTMVAMVMLPNNTMIPVFTLGLVCPI